MSARKYAAVFRLSSRDQLVYLPAFLIRTVLFLVLLFVFYSLWRTIFDATGAIAGFTLVQTIWYLTFTETIELSQTRIFIPISTEVKDGTVAYSLTRPYSYVAYWVSRAMGENIVKIAPLLLAGFLFARLAVGPLPGYFTAMPAGVLVIVLGVLVGTLFQTIIGLLAFWFEEVNPFWWIIQKLVFIVGGLFLPIDFYPQWMQGIALRLPFAFAAYWPASTWANFSWDRFATTVSGQGIYILLLGGVAALLFRTAVRRVHAQGG